ncbi:MAG: prolyl oligopeptidase family serine peptidase [Planctomycetota bacterium]|nr:prolyl oligopeptidase family serine peptidase [Planctomycetota bacterium]
MPSNPPAAPRVRKPVPPKAPAGPPFLLILIAVAAFIGLPIAAISLAPRFFPQPASPTSPDPDAKPAPAKPARFAASGNGRTFVRPPPPPSPDPLFDFNAIINDPLDVEVLKTTTSDGLVTEEFEYTSFKVDGKPDRVRGILVRPEDGSHKVPAVFWSQSGMYNAGPEFPTIFAKKGYVSLNVTLPQSPPTRRNGFAAFDAGNPKRANLTLLAIDQMRAITYLTQRPEVDAERVFAVGSSYGGFFAALLTGVDPRVVGGAAFFGAGHQAMGTNLPQFTGMKSPADIEAWNKLIDPAFRLKARAVPFLFTCPSNDNWFFPPSVVQSYLDAAGDCRLAIVPHWQHGFPPNIDQQIVDFADVVLNLSRAPYNKPAALKIENRDGKAVAQWSWTGENKVKRAELVVSYGPVHPWHHWLHRHHEIMPAKIEGSSASATIPIPFQGAKAYVYGNIIDEHDVLTSTVPVTLDSATLGQPGSVALTPDLHLNGVPFGAFEPADVDFLQALGEIPGTPDTEAKHGGAQSVRFDPLADPKAGAQSVRYKLNWSPGQAHHFSVWLRSAQPAKLNVRLEPAPVAQWTSPLVLELARHERPDAKIPTSAEAPAITKTLDVGEEWTQVQLDVPPGSLDIDGYNVRIIGDTEQRAAFWVDDLSFEPVWQTGG